MKKLSILFAGILVSAMIFTSCSKDDETTDANNLGKATVSGYVYLFADATTDTNGDLDVAADQQFAPAGTQLILKINSNDLAQDGNNPNAADKAYYATVGSNGKYTFSIDAGVKDVTITSLTGIDVELAYIRDEYAGGNKHDTTIIQHWSANDPAGFSVVQKQVVFQNLTYAGTPIH